MKDGYLGIAPHATSSKGHVFKGTVPGNLLTGIANQNVWTWIITGVFFFGLGMFFGLWFSPFMKENGLDDGTITAIISGITIGCGIIFSIYVIPELNKVFADAPDITQIDPGMMTIPTLGASHGMSAVLLFGGAFAAKKYYGKKEEGK